MLPKQYAALRAFSTPSAYLLRRRGAVALIALALYGVYPLASAQDAGPSAEGMLAQARNEQAAGKLKQALADVQEVQARWPGHADADRLEASLKAALAKQDKPAPAAAPAPAQSGDAALTADALLNQAHEERNAGHRVQALVDVQEVMARWPDNADAKRFNVTLLSELGASTQALEEARKLPIWQSAATRAQLEADLGAHQVRWARGLPADGAHPYAEADQAAATLRKLVDEPTTPEDIRLRAKMDLMVAYDQADQADNVLDLYWPLRRKRVPLPPYAELAVADALAQRHRARMAIPLYEDSIKRDPGPYDPSQTDPRINLAYAYLQAGHMRAALRTIHKLAKNEAAWIHVRDVKGWKANWRKEDADTAAASIEQDEGLLRQSYDELQALSNEAPNSADIRRELAMSELSRGWPRMALKQLQIADSIARRDANADLDYAAVHQQLYDYAAEEQDLTLAADEAGRSGRVQDAQDAWNRFKGWQFDLTHDNGWGNSPDYGDRDEETHVTVASPLIDNHWRVLALAEYESADLPEGPASRQRAGLGVQYFTHGTELYLEAMPSVDHFNRRTNIAAGFSWAINDQWSWSTDYNSASEDVPLRAQYYGITGNSVSTAVQWRASEMTSARLALYRDHFTDGNLREGWLGDFVQRVYTAPNVTFDGGVEIGGSHNSETDRPYFNPRADHSYSVTGSLQNLLHQNENFSWTQKVDVAVGDYQEQNYGSGLAVSARYGQQITPLAGTRVGWGVSYHYQPYDGRHESRVVLDLTLHWGE